MTDDQPPKAKRRGIAVHFDQAPMRLAGWAAHQERERAHDEIMVRLMAGEIMLGRLRRDRARGDVDAHLGHAQPPCGFTVPDYGLRAFAELSGLGDLAVVADGKEAELERHALPPMARGENGVDALGSRAGVRDSLRLGDVWLASARDLSLRFDGAMPVARSIDAYQCMLTGDRLLVKVAADQPIGGLVSLVTMKLVNPFLPVLLIFKGEDGAIDAIDLIPFPSLVRGGLHEGERILLSDGSDDLQGTAAVSVDLLRALLLREDRPDRHLASIVIDETVHTGLEPVLNRDLLSWMTTVLGVNLTIGGAADADRQFIFDLVERSAPSAKRDGHVLHLPADSIPTISALVRPLPEGLGAQQLSGAMIVADGDRHGRIASVWHPPLGAWLDQLQLRSGRRTVPLLVVEELRAADAARQPVLSWPLSVAFRDIPTRVVRDSPFEVSSELPLPLLRGAQDVSTAHVTVIIHTHRRNQPIAPLLESLVRQEGVAGFQIILVTPPGTVNADALDFLTSRFADCHEVVEQPIGRGKLDQIVAVRDRIVHDHVVIIGGDSLLPDPRTLATLLPMLDAPDVETVGCMVRSGQGKSARQAAGFSPAGMNIRAVPSLSFAAIDPAALRQPATFPVVANMMAVMAIKRMTVDRLDPRGSTAARPEVDDLLLGIQVIESGGLNLCSSLVSAYSNAPPAGAAAIGLSVPYRLSPDALARLTAATTIVQSLR